MKPSHMVTPRTLSDCYFDPRGSAIEVPYKRNSWLYTIFRGFFQ